MKTKRQFKISFIALFAMIIFNINAFAHGVQTAYCLQDNGFIRVYVEHWHGDLPADFMDGQVSITTQYGTTTSTQWLFPTGVINSKTINEISDCGTGITVLSSCPRANNDNDWVYYDFPPEVFEVLISITLNGGNNVFFTESCTELYPSSPIVEIFYDTFGPAITAPDINIQSCGENVDFNATILDNRDPNPTFTYSIASGSFFGVGSTQVTVDAIDDLGNTSSETFNVNVSPPAPDIQVTMASGTNKICEDGSGVITATSINGASYAWTGPNGFTSNDQSPTITDVGTYNVTLTLQDACTYYAYGSLEVGYSNIAVSLESTNPTCSDNSDGSVTAFKTDNIGISYASGGNTNPNLYSINKSTGATTVIGDMGIGGVPAIAINSSGKLFATNAYQLFEIDPVTAVSTLIGQMVGRCSNVPALAFDDQDVLYAWDHCGYFFTVDTSTGAMTLIGTPGISMSGMQFDPTDGSLWATDRNNIYKVNKSTGTLTNIGYTGYSQISDLVFEGNGNLFASRGGGNNQYLSINKTTGAGTLVANTVSNISGMTCNNGPGGITYLWNTGAITKTISGLPAGDYSVTVTNGLGCTATASVTLQVPPALEVNTGEAQTICDTPAQLNAIGNPNGAPVDPMITQHEFFNLNGGDFTNNLCNDGYDYFGNGSSFTENIAVSSITGLNFKIYYTNCFGAAAFTFKINGNVLGTYSDDAYSCDCNAANYGTYPVTASFTQSEVAALWGAGSNVVTVEINADVYLAGIVAEVLTAGEAYSWSPSAGLSDANIANPEALPTETTTYTVTYSTGNGCSVSSDVVVTVQCNLPPVALCQDIEVSADGNCQGEAVATDFDGGSSDPDGDDITFSISPEGPYALGETEVTLTVTDPSGEISTCIAKITVIDDEAPELTAPGSVSYQCIDYVPAAGMLGWTDNCDGAGEVQGSDVSDGLTCPETITRTWSYTDVAGNPASVSQTITVNDTEDPELGLISAPAGPVEISAGFALSATYSDCNAVTATWSVTSNDVDYIDYVGVVSNGSISLSAQDAASFETGVFKVVLDVVDDCGNSSEVTYEYVVIYDPSGGFVTGGGWIYSALGALTGSEAVGKANFGFVSKYKTGKNNVLELDGNTNFQFKEGDFHFKSSVYDEMSLVISGGKKATYRGVGTVNRSGSHKFLVTVIDGDAVGGDGDDKFRIKIWADGSSDDIDYDNEFSAEDNADSSTILGGGSIVIHKPKGNNNAKSVKTKEAPIEEEIFDGFELVSWPNPSDEYFNITLKSKNTVDKINIQVFDLNGRLVSLKTGAPNRDYKIGATLEAGLYFATVTQGNITKIVKLIKH